MQTPVFLLNPRIAAENFNKLKKNITNGKVSIAYSMKVNPRREIMKILGKHNVYFLTSSEKEINIAKRYGKILFYNPVISEAMLQDTAKHINYFIADSHEQAHLIKKLNPNVRVLARYSLPNQQFGMNGKQIEMLAKEIGIDGIHAHPLFTKSTLARERFLPLVKKLKRKYNISVVDLGGTLPRKIARLRSLVRKIKTMGIEEIIVEPGTAIVENAIVLIMKVIKTKQVHNKHIAFVNASLYNTIPDRLIINREYELRTDAKVPGETHVYGNSIDALDYFGIVNRKLSPNDLVAVLDAGAYQFHTELFRMPKVRYKIVKSFPEWIK